MLFFQVCKRDLESKVLVCAPQNYAADLITELLLEEKFLANSVLRFNAVSRSCFDISEKVRALCISLLAQSSHCLLFSRGNSTKKKLNLKKFVFY